MRKDFEETKELKGILEKEASELMEKVTKLSNMRDESTMSKTGKEVRELQMEVSKMMQQGSVAAAGVDQELLEGKLKLEAFNDNGGSPAKFQEDIDMIDE